MLESQFLRRDWKKRKGKRRRKWRRKTRKMFSHSREIRDSRLKSAPHSNLWTGVGPSMMAS